jgi:ABC-type antimicrobial peptide transport system permease subunit
VQHAEDRVTGYERNNLVQVNFAGDIEKNYELIRQDLLQSGTALSVSKNMAGITHGGWHTWALRWPGEAPKDTNTTITLFSTDAEMVRTTGMELIAGRDIDIRRYPADSFSVVLNEQAVRTMGFRDPVGQVITDRYAHVNWRVVGVVKDYVGASPWELVPPIVIEGPGSWFNVLHIRFNPAQTTARNLAGAEQIFRKYNPAYPFDFQFVDQQYAAGFEEQQRTKRLAGLFAGLAIFISCLGLLGLSAYVAESRIREIGVRKVFGASVWSIVRLLSMDFVRLVLIALLIAIPVAWIAMDRWLRDYAYRIQIGWTIFLVAGALAVFIALATVSYQSIRAALMNPGKSLRTE